MNRPAVALRRAFIGASVTWALALPGAAFLTSYGSGLAPTVAAVVLYGAGSVVCHQIPARSFELWGRALPVCARCTGLYAGAAAIALAAASGARFRFARGGQPARLLITIAALPTVLTLAYEWISGDAPSNILRATSALPLGAAVAAIVLTAADDGVN